MHVRSLIGRPVFKLLTLLVGAPIEIRLQQSRDNNGRFIKQ
jgi:hypothetical protein